MTTSGLPSNSTPVRLRKCPYCDQHVDGWKITSSNFYGKSLRCDLFCPNCDGRIEASCELHNLRYFNENGHGRQTSHIAVERKPFLPLTRLPRWLKLTITIHLLLCILSILVLGFCSPGWFGFDLIVASAIAIVLSQSALLSLITIAQPQFAILPVVGFVAMSTGIWFIDNAELEYVGVSAAIVFTVLCVVGLIMRSFGITYWKSDLDLAQAEQPDRFSIKTIMLATFGMATLLGIAKIIGPVELRESSVVFGVIGVGAAVTATFSFWTRNTFSGLLRLAITIFAAGGIGMLLAFLVQPFDLETLGIMAGIFVIQALCVIATMTIPRQLGYRFLREV